MCAVKSAMERMIEAIRTQSKFKRAPPQFSFNFALCWPRRAILGHPLSGDWDNLSTCHPLYLSWHQTETDREAYSHRYLDHGFIWKALMLGYKIHRCKKDTKLDYERQLEKRERERDSDLRDERERRERMDGKKEERKKNPKKRRETGSAGLHRSIHPEV